MKTLKSLAAVTILLVGLVFASCSKDEFKDMTPERPTPEVPSNPIEPTPEQLLHID